MDLDRLNFLPEWEDDKFGLSEEGEEWKTAEATNAAKALYLQWREIFGFVIAFADNLCEDPEAGEKETHEQMIKKLIYENVMIVAPKIIGASGCGLYILQMENAAIIRTNCRQLMEQVGFTILIGIADAGHEKVIKEAMNEFKKLFKIWVATFKKDEYRDDWGLFN